MINTYREKIYAGVLGKCLGVYMGRPVEGWFYDRINQAFGEVYNFKHKAAGAPLIVPDDDISGTFAFFRALEDNGYPKDLTAKQIGDTWLNYLVENKTILWWGGLSRSTEHSAYIRLKEGIPAPESGSIAQNGQSMAEAIGAEIFIDTWALVNPNQPELAVRMAKEAASVSHDGIAVSAACFLAAMESMAFEETNMDVLIDRGLSYVDDGLLHRLVADVREQCRKASDWHEVREWIAANHGYEKYPGNCPMITNHLVVLAALLMGGDDFNKSIMIAASAGWDTDCNAGNVGCLNGIRLGLEGINGGADLRGPVADRLYVVTADGGDCVSDAVLETRKILRAAAELYQENVDLPDKRYAFEYPGSVQGFMIHPDYAEEQALCGISNPLGQGLELEYRHLAPGSSAAACVETYVDKSPKGVGGTSYFEVYASPNLYPTQTINALFFCPDEETPSLRFFVDYYDGQDQLQKLTGEEFLLKPGENLTSWEVPEHCGQAIYRLGIQLDSKKRLDGKVILKWMDWTGAPRKYEMGKSYEMTPSLVTWTNETIWLKTFVSSADNFYPDYLRTFSVSHPGKNGIVTTGGPDWKDYTVTSAVTFSQQECAGLVARAKGHRRYYAAVFQDGKAKIIRRKDWEITELAAVPYAYKIDGEYQVSFTVKGKHLSMAVNGKTVAEAEDSSYAQGGAGYVVDRGAILGDGFTVERV
ncbi:ADP-ribosylglycohydrolase family protein [Lactonifactor longoviformis]|uniref:ADP-ribosylglycohydrolase n=1 Tax=Lactonifactor longoviformis DSM 17459 TaxID=1122155 RepID=A0A1M4V338_9CLOT|nr:ADP-ribosylglycohydrolase family protein [Lactonifactor longoviformis]POP34515.1 ADP-ribosylglycohydrolase family protein [Lactonifactor longoviformis]SHE63293.1 ADP-ribosylglycohydrolase [Lactonifactor longoviformis DSM 17459]